MAEPSNGITFRTIQEAMPEYHLSNDLVRGVLGAMPPPAAGISHAWRRERLARVVDEVAARVPMDAAQGHLAGQIVVAEFVSLEMLERVTTWELPLAERRLASRTSDDLIRSITRLERTLERRQMRVMPFRDVGAVEAFDLDMLDRVWCRGMPAAGAAPVAALVTPRPEVALAPVTPGPEVAPTPVTPVQVATPVPQVRAVRAAPEAAVAQSESAAAGVGQARDGGNAGGLDRRSRAGVTLEQGDGWSLEVWPATPGAGVGLGPVTRDKRAGPVAAAGSAMAAAASAARSAAPSADHAAANRVATGRAALGRATTGRAGPRGVA